MPSVKMFVRRCAAVAFLRRFCRLFVVCLKYFTLLLVIAFCILFFIPTRNILLSPVLPGHWHDHSTARLLKTYFGTRQAFPLSEWKAYQMNDSTLKNFKALDVNLTDVVKFSESSEKLFPEFYAELDRLKAKAKGDPKAARQLSTLQYFTPVLTPVERSQLLFTVDVFIRACLKHGLAFFPGEGTLLGAYRHHGLVPWDDDVDMYVNASQWREMYTVLHNIPGFTLQASSKGLWKFFLSSLPPFKGKKRPYKWPSIDLFWFAEDSSHVWGLTKAFYEFLLMDRAHFLPLTYARWERWWVPVPSCWRRYAQQRFVNTDVCMSTENSHKQDHKIASVTVPCRDLYAFFPFVFRDRGREEGVVVERRMVGGRVVETFDVASEPASCCGWKFVIE